MQEKETVLLSDSRYEAVSFQIKFISAVVAGTFGHCYPFVILVTAQFCTFTLMYLARQTNCSNVLSVCPMHNILLYT